MSMEHKAYEFDWDSFENELLSALLDALREDDNSKLLEFIACNLESITDPYEGEPLDKHWRENLIHSPTQEIADYALTKYYSVNDDLGLGSEWLSLKDSLKQQEIDSLLGVSYQEFDPGCCGSYFQSIEQLKAKLPIDYSADSPTLKLYLDDMARITKGLYVTF